MIGTRLGDRYEILQRIGGGGMAIVYKGHDVLLNRKVAVKVLRDQYVHDDEFIRRFQREAQAAASLSHPNIVSIYDVGKENDVHYIVMEYVEGTTLNEVIKEKAPMQVEEAIHYTTQICDALDHAHSNQIVHRDIKPHNILIGKNGRIKVTDFGIARATTSSTITQTGSVVGSVHYFSPEHAKGVSAGAKSDLYSLGIVLYQMLTGRLPFLGESPISVALKHLQENVEDPRNVNPLIPQSVENIILKSMRKNPEERYSSARKMQGDLESCLLPERRNEPKAVFDEDEMDGEITRVVPAIRAGQFAESAEDDESDPEARRLKARRKRKKFLWISPLVWLIILVAIGYGGWNGAQWLTGKWFVPSVDIPDVTNMTVEQAEQKLDAARLSYHLIEQFSDTVDSGIVMRQSPSKMKLKVNSVVDLYVSQGVEKQKMPDYVGKPLKDVKLELVETLGLKPEQIQATEVFLDDPPGTVVKQSPVAGEQYALGDVKVMLTVSKGRQTFKMPDLVGRTIDEAKARLEVSGLKLDNNVTREPSYKQDEGKIIKQYPYEPNDEVSLGEEIKVVLSSGLPAEAGQMMISVPIKPEQDGKNSTIKIMLSDARYDDLFEVKSLTVSKTAVVDVKAIVSRNKKATIQVKRDDKVVDVITKTYQDYLDQKNGKPTGTTSTNPASPASTAPSSGSGGATSPTGTTAAPSGTAPNTGTGSAGGSTGSPTSPETQTKPSGSGTTANPGIGGTTGPTAPASTGGGR
jgi:serine/threonine-protein kinase